MATYSKENSCLVQIKRLRSGVILVLALACFSVTGWAETANQPKAVWYRYYDQNGVANISTSVTPAHIRHGYEALDRNMQVIRQNRPYSAEADIRQSPQRALQARQQAQDTKLKQAYTNSRVAQAKRNEALENLKKQISFQQEQLRQLQNDRILFKRQEMEYLRKGQPVAPALKHRLENNNQNIIIIKNNIETLQSNYRNTQAQYDRIISRLKVLE